MWASSPMSRKHSQIRLHTSACGLRAHFVPPSRSQGTVAQSETHVAPGSDRTIACHNAHNAARKIRRCTGSEIGMAPRAEQTNSCVVSWICAAAHPVCPPCAPCLHIKDPSNKQLASQTVADNTRVYPHMYRTVVNASSPGLSLLLMSRRKSKRVSRYAGHVHNRAEPNTAGSHFRQNGCSVAPALFATSCVHHPACITHKAALIASRRVPQSSQSIEPMLHV